MEDVTYDVNKLEELKRPQLQKLCKNLGLKANSKTSQLISDLKKHAKKVYSAQQNKKSKTPEQKTPESSLARPAITMVEQSKSTNSECEMKEESDPKHMSEDQSYKDQIMQQLERKVQETLKESKIPRLNTKNVTFTIGTTSANAKSQSKTREHQAFKKMDSIDVYLEKKRKRTQSLYANIKKAKGVANTARNIIADMKASHNTPARQSPKKKRRSTYSIDKSKAVQVPTSFSFGHLKSPKVGQNKQKTPANAPRKSLSSLSKAKENKTPFETRKSIAVTPFRYTGRMDTTANSTVSAKKKFDLQASLSKPLSYKPHKGKIQKFPLSKKDSKIPVLVNKKPLVDHKVDVKNVKVTSRHERRQNTRSNRADKRHNAMLAKRGLAN